MGIGFLGVLFIIGCLCTTALQSKLSIARNAHTPQEFSDAHIQYLAELSNVTHLEEALDRLLIPRVVGTENHKKVRRYITSELKKLGWTIEIDAFNDTTPNFGRLTFRNIIATLNPNAKRFLVLACHYDSKYFSDFDFIGATDSAVPCAMMLNLAYVMKKDLNNIKNDPDLTLKLIFFDGEEAFQDWGPNDSIYGAKHLATKWYRTAKSIDNEVVTHLQQIDILVLLDLLGTPNPKIYCLIEPTKRWYLRVADAEEKLAYMSLLKNYIPGVSTYFNKFLSHASIEDDHVPFLEKRVPVVHLIPTPFPSEWHTPADDRSALDMTTIENLNKILRIFTAEYLHLFVTY